MVGARAGGLELGLTFGQGWASIGARVRRLGLGMGLWLE